MVTSQLLHAKQETGSWRHDSYFINLDRQETSHYFILITANAGDADSNPGWGRSPGEGNGNPL